MGSGGGGGVRGGAGGLLAVVAVANGAVPVRDVAPQGSVAGRALARVLVAAAVLDALGGGVAKASVATPAEVGARVAVVHGGRSGGVGSGGRGGVGSGVRGGADVGETPAVVAMADGAVVVGAVAAVGVAVAGDVPTRKET